MLLISYGKPGRYGGNTEEVVIPAGVYAGATAFGSHAMPYLMEFNSSWTDPGDSDANIAWTRKVWDDMAARFSSGNSGYLNMTCYNEHGKGLVKETYGVNYRRLREVKRQYDPGNLFRLNANILPG